jgi:hypothetical protein
MTYLETLGANIETGIKKSQQAAVEGGIFTIGEVP